MWLWTKGNDFWLVTLFVQSDEGPDLDNQSAGDFFWNREKTNETATTDCQYAKVDDYDKSQGFTNP